MLQDIITKGSTDKSVRVKIIDATDGTPENGVVYNTSGIDLWYRREGGIKVSITEASLATPALDDPHADGGFLLIGDGMYRLDLPDAAFASGADYVEYGGSVTGMIVGGGVVKLVDSDVAADWADGGRLDLLLDAVKAVTDVMNSAQTEPTGVPASNETPIDKLAYLFMMARNRKTVTASKKTYYGDDDSPEFEADISDDDTTYDESEINSI